MRELPLQPTPDGRVQTWVHVQARKLKPPGYSTRESWHRCSRHCHTMPTPSRRRPRKGADATSGPAAGQDRTHASNKKGGAKKEAAPTTEAEEEDEEGGSRVRFIIELFLFPATMVLIIGGVTTLTKRQRSVQPKVRDIMVLGSMSSGSRSMASELRGLGLDVEHEGVGGTHGTVSWLHSLLYMPTSDPSSYVEHLCDQFIPNAWHPVLLAGETATGCGFDDGADMRELSVANDAAARMNARRCWQRVCPHIVDAFRSCASTADGPSRAYSACPIDFGPPLLMARHPLSVISSFVAGYCDSDPVSRPSCLISCLAPPLHVSRPLTTHPYF